MKDNKEQIEILEQKVSNLEKKSKKTRIFVFIIVALIVILIFLSRLSQDSIYNQRINSISNRNTTTEEVTDTKENNKIPESYKIEQSIFRYSSLAIMIIIFIMGFIIAWDSKKKEHF